VYTSNSTEELRGPTDVPQDKSLRIVVVMVVFSHSDWNLLEIDGWNHLAGHYCEFPGGDVDSPVFYLDVHCQKMVLCPCTVNGLHGV
jgi:hypothetical protein